jgi:hypothetical protein
MTDVRRLGVIDLTVICANAPELCRDGILAHSMLEGALRRPRSKFLQASEDRRSRMKVRSKRENLLGELQCDCSGLTFIIRQTTCTTV